MNDNKQLIRRFAQGILRWTAEKEIDIEDDVQAGRLNLFLKYINNTESGEFYDSDFNGLSYAEMIEIFHLNLSVSDYSTPDDVRYNSVHIPTFEALQEYRQWTDDWCITLSESAFEEYAEGGEKQYYLLLRDDFRAVPKKPSDRFPNDSYGESILCVIVDSDGSIASVTNRWNAIGREVEKPEEYLQSLIGESYKSMLFNYKND